MKQFHPYTCNRNSHSGKTTSLYQDAILPWSINNIPIVPIEQFPVPYPTMLHSEQKCAHFCSEWSIMGYGPAFWDL